MTSAIDLNRYLDAIVDMTRHRDPQELASALLETLRRCVPARQVRLLAIANDNRDTEFNEGNIAGATVYDLLDAEAGEPRPLAEDADLRVCCWMSTCRAWTGWPACAPCPRIMPVRWSWSPR